MKQTTYWQTGFIIFLSHQLDEGYSWRPLFPSDTVALLFYLCVLIYGSTIWTWAKSEAGLGACALQDGRVRGVHRSITARKCVKSTSLLCLYVAEKKIVSCRLMMKVIKAKHWTYLLFLC